MFKDLIYLLLFVILWAVDSWADCREITSYGNQQLTCAGYCRGFRPTCLSCPQYQNCDYYVLIEDRYSSCECAGGQGGYYDSQLCVYLQCDTPSQRDSAACLHSGDQWIDGECRNEKWVCENGGGTWNEQTQSCISPCNEYTNPHQECVQTWDNGYNECEGLNCVSGGYWKINIYQCYFDSCAMAKVCTEGSSFPAGNLTCDDWNDQDTTTSENCTAAIGHECVIGCPDKRTITCDCDGSCLHAKTIPSCQCVTSSPSSSPSSSASSSPSSSPSSSASDSGQSSNSGVSSSNNDNPFSSGSGGNGLDNALLGQIEYNTRKTKENTLVGAGYLSSIDRWQSIHNANMISQQKQLEALKSGVSEANEANKAQTDTIHNSNVILSGIANVITDTISYFDNLTSWNDSSRASIDSLKTRASRGPDTLSVDSLKSDTSQYKTKFSSLFINNAQTRNGCYEFKMKKPTGSGSFGQKMQDVVIDFGNVGGIFDLCSIGRGFIRVCGAILVIMTMIVSYKMAFRGGE